MHQKNPYYSHTDTTQLNVSDAEWKKILPEEVFEVARNKDTERAFTGKPDHHIGHGSNPLFRQKRTLV